MKTYITILLSFLLAPCCIHAQAVNSNKLNKNFHLYILMGQSNMAGRGKIVEPYKSEGHPRVLMLNKENQWVPAQHPLHFDKTVAGVGPGLSFAINMANMDNNVTIGLIPCAVGGTSINSWQPGGYDSATKTHPYDDALIRIEAAMKSGVVKGMLWHQGESDSKPAAAQQYIAKLKVLIERIRTVTHNAVLPVVAGELGRYREPYQVINAELAKLPSVVPATALASSEGLVDKGDHTHFDSPSAEILGERFADKMISLQGKSTKRSKRSKGLL